jgi:hypothetical protein
MSALGSKADITWTYRNVAFYLRKRTFVGVAQTAKEKKKRKEK